MRSSFIALTTVLLVLLYSFLNYNKNNNIQMHLEKETAQYSIVYNTLYKEFKSKSQLIFDLLIDKKQVIDIYKEVSITSKNTEKSICNQRLFDLRERLYKELKNKYSKIKENAKIPSINFHTKENLSFLSMDKLEKFCYDLTPVRPLLVKVNSIKEPIDGFEIGKTSSKYRFLFPIIVNNVHLGSVEISYDSLIFINEFMGHSNVLAQIHVSKEIVDQKFDKDEELKQYYKQSPLQGMYTVNKLISNLEKQSKKNYQKIVTSKPIREEIEKRIQTKQDAFSIYDYVYGDSITIIPIKNPASHQREGYFSIKHFSKYLENEKLTFYNHFLTISCFIIFIMFLTYKYFSSKIKRTKLLSRKNKELTKKQNKLKNINTDLEQIVTEKINENLKQSDLISKQAKIAALGEMMDAIAHQWKQPLSVIDMTINNLVLKIDFNEKVSNKDIVDLGENTRFQIDHLITTIDEFRQFFRPNQPTKNYNVKDIINLALQLEKDYLIQNKTNINVNIDETLDFKCIKTEFVHVVLNIINNSIDAFIANNIEDRLINISAYKNNTNVAIEICDNAKGIPTDVLPNIFKSNYTTKAQGQGTGIGLYLAKQIIEKIDASIEAYNKKDGVCFKITV